jgi:hypothetical protein
MNWLSAGLQAPRNPDTAPLKPVYISKTHRVHYAIQPNLIDMEIEEFRRKVSGDSFKQIGLPIRRQVPEHWHTPWNLPR